MKTAKEMCEFQIKSIIEMISINIEDKNKLGNKDYTYTNRRGDYHHLGPDPLFIEETQNEWIVELEKLGYKVEKLLTFDKAVVTKFVKKKKRKFWWTKAIEVYEEIEVIEEIQRDSIKISWCCE